MPENQRLFIAAFPPPALRQTLFRIAQKQQLILGGRCMPQDNLHLTLTFLGQTPNSAIPAILAQLQQMPALDCEFTLDTLDTFTHTGIVWAGGQQVPSPLMTWVADLRTRLKDANIAFDSRPFCPHITLLRKATGLACALDPALVWHLGRAQLYASQPNSDERRYVVISSVP